MCLKLQSLSFFSKGGTPVAKCDGMMDMRVVLLVGLATAACGQNPQIEEARPFASCEGCADDPGRTVRDMTNVTTSWDGVCECDNCLSFDGLPPETVPCDEQPYTVEMHCEGAACDLGLTGADVGSPFVNGSAYQGTETFLVTFTEPGTVTLHVTLEHRQTHERREFILTSVTVE
jgi:hypothetical protein